VVSNDSPCTKISSLPSCSSLTPSLSEATSSFCCSSSLSDPEEESFLAAAFLAGAAFFTGFSSESESEEEAAAFLAGAAFLTGFSSESDDEPDEESFLATFLAGAVFLTSLTDSSEESESDDDSTFFFDYGTFWFSVFLTALFFDELALLVTLLPLTFDVALGLLAITFFSDSLLSSLSLSELLSFFFLRSFLVSLTTATAFFLSASFCKNYKKLENATIKNNLNLSVLFCQTSKEVIST